MPRPPLPPHLTSSTCAQAHALRPGRASRSQRVPRIACQPVNYSRNCCFVHGFLLRHSVYTHSSGFLFAGCCCCCRPHSARPHVCMFDRLLSRECTCARAFARSIGLVCCAKGIDYHLMPDNDWSGALRTCARARMCVFVLCHGLAWFMSARTRERIYAHDLKGMDPRARSIFALRTVMVRVRARARVHRVSERDAQQINRQTKPTTPGKPAKLNGIEINCGSQNFLHAQINRRLIMH